MEITRINIDDFQNFWPIFKRIVSARETFPIAPDISYDEAFEIWCLEPQFTYISKLDGLITGSYYLKPNGSGPGAHICNCAYMIDEGYNAEGTTRLLCQHSQQVAINAGYKAMQFNSVVASDSDSIQLWEELGFSITGVIPQGFRHRHLGLVDVYIMYKPLLSAHVRLHDLVEEAREETPGYGFKTAFSG